VSIASLRLARGGTPSVSPLSPPSDTLRLLVGEDGQSPPSLSLVVHQQPARKSGGPTLETATRELTAGKGSADSLCVVVGEP
jgi:hypothetical protein